MITRRRLLGALGATAAAGAAAAATAPPSWAQVGSGGLPSAAAFRDTVGVNAHWGFLDTPYAQSYRRVRDLLVDSGIRHVRGEASRAADLASSGVRTTVLVDSDDAGRGDPAQIVHSLVPLAASGAVVGLEAPNEPDHFWVRADRRYRGEPFPAGAAAWQRDLYAAAKADPATRGLPVIGMSFGRTYWGGGHPFGPGSLAATADWANLHSYPNGNPYFDRFSYGGVRQYYNHSDFPTVALDQAPINLRTYRPPFGDLPLASTETGYSTWRFGQSEESQALYLPRVFLEHFRLGFRRTFVYELVDEFHDPSGDDREAHFGLVRHDLTPKPAYHAVRSLLGALAEGSGPEVEAPAFDPSITVRAAAGYDPRAVHSLALAKRDGTVVLALWHEVSANDLSGLDADPRRPLRKLAHPAATVSVDLGARARRASAQYIHHDGSLRPKALAGSGSVRTAIVGDRVTLLTLPPG